MVAEPEVAAPVGSEGVLEVTTVVAAAVLVA